jgi:hypothetical protein
MGFKSSHLTLINLKTKKVMNRKFFTWVAGTLLLAASFGTAKAVTIETGKSNIAIATYPNTNGKLYQLHATTGAGGSSNFVLTVDGDGVLGIEKTTAYTKTYGESLWCINFGSPDPKVVDFTNRAHTTPLKVSIDDVTDVEKVPAAEKGLPSVSAKLGDLQGWKFSETYKTAVETKRPLYTYFDTENEPDAVLVFAAVRDSLVIVKASVSEVNKAAGSSAPVYLDEGDEVAILLFTLWEPAEIILTAAQFNTNLATADSTARTLAFTKSGSRGVNPWKNNKLIAVPVYGGDAYEYKASDKTVSYVRGGGELSQYVRFAEVSGKAANPAKFVRVDTAYTPGSNEYLAFKIDSIWGFQGEAAFGASKIINQYDFLVKYDVANDSLSILPREVYKAPGAKGWIEENPSNKYTLEGADGANRMYVKWANVIDNESVVTVGLGTVDTKISLGLECEGASSNELTSIDQGVYVIIKDGQVLGVPIYSDKAEWITLTSTVDPNYIPAYQWVVKKTRSNAEVSPISLTNREHKTVYQSSLQLTEEDDAIANQLGTSIKIAKSDFKELPDDLKKDEYLGYFYITDEEATYNTYDLNYLHKLSTSHYLGEDTDTSVVVKESGRTQFQLTYSGKVENYGFEPWKDADFAQLKKVSYTLTQTSNGKTVKLNDKSKRFTLKDSDEDAKVAIFTLKTSNTANDKQYYTLLYGEGKLAVNEDLWAYEVTKKEQSAAAFALTEGTAPVYRKFDGESYTYGNGQETIEEPFGTTDGAPLWLKFTKQNNLGNQYLSEYSEGAANGAYRSGLENESISFLGLYNAAQYPENATLKYTFYVDTAYVQRPASTTSTVVTLKPQYLLAIRPDIAAAIEPGEEEEEGESYPALTKASYLFNAQDSVDAKNYDYAGKAAYGLLGSTRLAFVEGVHLGDTLYVLPTELIEKTAAQLQEEPELLYAINKDRKIALDKNSSYQSAKGDAKNNKSVVFQFRLLSGDETNPNLTRAFLIETETNGGLQVPTTGKYVKIFNDVPVVGAAASFGDAVSKGEAEVFNVESGDENGAVSNEKVAATSKVRVLSGAGSINILNATGKKVTVTNILGQTLTTQVLTSDNARISLPQGVVIVSVKGEPAVKAIVSK